MFWSIVNNIMLYIWEDFPGGSVVKNLPAVQELQKTRVQSLGWEDPLEEAWQPTPEFLPGESMDRDAWWVLVHRVPKNWI